MKQTTIINYAVLWDRISKWSRKAGRVSTRPVLLLFYVMKSKETPWSDKMLVFSAISYLVFPIDILDAKRFDRWFPEYAPYELIAD